MQTSSDSHSRSHLKMACLGATEKLVEEEESNGHPAEAPPLLQVLPRVVPRDRNKEDRGGYDCELVDPPSPKVMQTECSVCLQILKEPCLISCCGHKFCRDCIEQVEKTGKPCPLCNEPGFTFLKDRGLERSLKDLEARCSYKKEGCEWIGKLGDLDEHLNRDPFHENQLNGCQFVEVECTYKCGEWFQRRYIAMHETQQCKKRAYSCDYCRDYHSTFEDVTEVHHPQCGKYPIACPNDCDVYLVQQEDMNTHLLEVCPLTKIDCPFRYAGCEMQTLRKDMPQHVKESYAHVTLLASFTEKLAKENHELRQKALEKEAESYKSLQEFQQKTEEEFQCLRKEIQELKESKVEIAAEVRHIAEKTESIETIVDENCESAYEEIEKCSLSTLRNYHRIYHSLMQHCHNEVQDFSELPANIKVKKEVDLRSMYFPAFPIYFNLKNFEQQRRVNGNWFSTAFYTHSRGYRMCLRVFPNGNGDGQNTHVSIFVQMMRGRFDGYLKWPFKGEVTIEVANQAGWFGHRRHTVAINDDTSMGCADRVIHGERANSGLGIQTFIKHSDLVFTFGGPMFLKNDCLSICVKHVKML